MLRATLLYCIAGTAYAGEVLQSISDDYAVPMAASKSAKGDGDHIIYRVSCQPGDEALPDCERRFEDNDVALPMPDLPQDAEDESEAKSVENDHAASVKAVGSKPVAVEALAQKKSIKAPSKTSKTKAPISKTKVSGKGSRDKKPALKRKAKS